jgi:hypothetical protein
MMSIDRMNVDLMPIDQMRQLFAGLSSNGLAVDDVSALDWTKCQRIGCCVNN